MHIVRQDLLTFKEGIIAHGCNAQGVFNSGIAKQIRQRYHMAYSDYLYRYKVFGLQLGDVVFSQVSSKLTIASCVTQEYYGRDPDVVYVDYEAVGNCLKVVVDRAIKDQAPLAFPYIGGGLGNGDRDVLMAIFRSATENYEQSFLYID